MSKFKNLKWDILSDFQTLFYIIFLVHNTEMYFVGGDTSGTMAIADLDGDGFMELISAGYSANIVYVHTFKQ